MPETVLLPLSRVERNPRLWPRKELCPSWVKELAALYRDRGPEALRPIRVASPGPAGTHPLIDGWHRMAAALLADLPELPAVVEPLESPDAIYERAVFLSARGSLRMSRAEKQVAVDRLVAAAPDRPDRRIAQIVGVSHTFVSRRRKLQGRSEPERPRPAARPRPDRNARSLLRAGESLFALGSQGLEEEARVIVALADAARPECGPGAAEHLEAVARWLHEAAVLLPEAAPVTAAGPQPESQPG
jgi:ParB-like chromosome segregation protein Spo0J